MYFIFVNMWRIFALAWLYMTQYWSARFRVISFICFFYLFFHFICRVVCVLGFHEHRTIFHYDIKSDDHVYLVPAVDIGWFKSCDILITKCPDRKTPFRKSDVYLRCYFSLFFGYSMKKICKWCFRLYWPFVSIDEFLRYSYAIIFD